MKSIERIIDCLKTHRINDLQLRLNGNGGLIKEQYEEIDRLSWELVGTRFALMIAVVALIVVSYQIASAPVLHVAGLECRL